RFSAIWGPLLFGVIQTATGSSRNAILSLVSFIVVGIILLSRVNEQEAKRQRDDFSIIGQ
ncbi:MAG: MFS transporter, partial [Candidatus Poribacteria bacterium]|nr:MFS transporter [Candidatus Poribacteria bacterium]